MTTEINPVEFGIEPVKAKEMLSGLSIAYSEREVLKQSYIDVIELPITKENLSSFKELRLKIVKNRTQGFESWHKTNKAFYLAGGRFVDAIKNKEVLENEQMESKLLEAEKFFENQEKERIQKLHDSRIELIKQYREDVTGLELGNMDEQIFQDFLSGAKTRFENEQKQREAEVKRIEAERLAEIERQKAIEAENAKLKSEAEAKQKALEKERAEALAKQKTIQDAADKKAREEKAKQDAILKAEQEAKAKVEAELQAKKEAEAKAESERIAKEKAEKLEAEKLAKAPIKKQLSVWVNSFEIPTVGVDNETSKEIKEKFEAFKKWSLTQVNNL